MLGMMFLIVLIGDCAGDDVGDAGLDDLGDAEGMLFGGGGWTKLGMMFLIDSKRGW